MQIKTIDLSSDLNSITGLVIVIDVLRAFTTACYILENNASLIYPVADLEHARALKKDHPDWILIGERKGIKLADFDYGNSPAELENVDFKNQTVIFTTSSGTQTVEKLHSANEIITGAFVNANAIVNYIKNNSFSEVTFVCTDNRWKDNEDYKLAEYISDLILDNQVDFNKIKNHIVNHPTADGFLKKPFTPNSKKDFELSFDLDKFDFVISAEHDGDHVYLKRIYKYKTSILNLNYPKP